MRWITIWLLFLVATRTHAQETKPRHSIAVLFSLVNTFEGRDQYGNKKTLTMPGGSLDYDFYLTPVWKLGLHNDITIEKFTVDKNLGNGEEIERSFPIASVVVTTYKVSEHWGIQLGVGGEFEKKECFYLMRAGLDYSSELPKGWEVFGNLSYDMRLDAYDTWTLGIGVAKLFGGKK